MSLSACRGVVVMRCMQDAKLPYVEVGVMLSLESKLTICELRARFSLPIGIRHVPSIAILGLVVALEDNAIGS